MAACYAAENCQVTLFEKEKRLGRKVLASGNGRCNISNRNIGSNRYHGKNPQFVNNLFGAYGVEETIAFFHSIGLPIVEMQEGKLFPASLQASSVMNVFVYELKKRGVDVCPNSFVRKICHEKDEFTIVQNNGNSAKFDSVILATGSCAYPSLGGTNMGYELANSLGHRVHPPFPVILPLNMNDKKIRRLQGIKWDCNLSVVSEGKVLGSHLGELLFTGYGISGPVALAISRMVNKSVVSRREVFVEIDFFPHHSEESLKQLLEELWSDKRKKLSFSLCGILKERMPEVIIEMAGLNPEMRTGELSAKTKNKVVQALKKTVLHPGNHRGFAEAVAASGGVSTDEVNPKTMESLKQRGLYLTGELLDIDGDSGGFNIQFAWSSGAVAGMAQ